MYEDFVLFLVIWGNVFIKFVDGSWVRVVDYLILGDVRVIWIYYEIGRLNLNDGLYF